jgi:hypothetical protein
MAFYVGQKVCRLRELPASVQMAVAQKRFEGGNVPEPGGIYTIRAIRQGTQDGVTLLLLKELDNSHMLVEGREPGFDSRNFRPIVERKTSIAIFKAMLNPSRQEVSA